METINRNRLFTASCIALVVTSMTFAIRAGMIEPLGVQFGLNNKELGWITSMAFLGFPIAVIIGGMLVDIVGMGRLMLIAFISHLLGIILTIYAGGFWTLLISTLLIGIANGTVEAACNPLIASMFPENKTTKLNHFHIWFPGGIVIGGLVGYFVIDQFQLGWEIAMATMILPTIIYGIMFWGQSFPPTERVAEGVSSADMYKSIVSPLFLLMVLCMFGTAITELGTTQWIDVLLKNVASGGLLVLVFINTIMAVGRGFAGPIVHRFSPAGVLFVSSILAALGLYLLSATSGAMVFAAAAVFALGVTYFWPTMLGFVAEYVPRSGALGLAVVGAAGMFATFLFQPVIGSVYDAALVDALPQGAELVAYKAAEAGSPEATAFAEAQVSAGPAILRRMVVIPSVLIVVFGLLFANRKRLEGNKAISNLTPVAE